MCLCMNHEENMKQPGGPLIGPDRLQTSSVIKTSLFTRIYGFSISAASLLLRLGSWFCFSRLPLQRIPRKFLWTDETNVVLFGRSIQTQQQRVYFQARWWKHHAVWLFHCHFYGVNAQSGSPHEQNTIKLYSNSLQSGDLDSHK